jgi:lipoprotein NlpI
MPDQSMKLEQKSPRLNQVLMVLTVVLTTALVLENTQAQTADTTENANKAENANKVANPLNERELQSLALTMLAAGEQTQALDAANQLIQRFSDSPASMLTVADTLLRCGKPEDSLQYFDRYLEARPDALPYLWQRGIAQYFAGRHRDGVKQFEVHRRVNPNDVENAAWHFLCLARAESFEKATQLVLPAPDDPRIPMEEVLGMLKTGDTERVATKMESVPEGSGSRSRADFYGYFYLGLYADAKGDSNKALELLKKSAADAPHHYMGDVARVYVQYLTQQQQR